MILRIFILFLCLTSASYVNAQAEHQSKIDSILTDLQSELKPRARIAKHLKLITYYNFSHPSVDSLIESALTIAEEGNYQFFIARTLKFRARHNLYMNESPDIIKGDIDRIKHISHNFKNKLLPVWISGLYAEYYNLTGKLDSAKIYLDSLEVQIVNNTYTDKGYFYTIKGMYHQANREYSLAMSEYNMALTKKHSGKTFIYNNLASLHLELLNPKKAIEYANKSLEYGLISSRNIAKINSYHLLGEAYLLQTDTIKAIENFLIVEELRAQPYNSKNYTSIHRLIDIYKITDKKKIDDLLDDLTSYKVLNVYSKLLVEKGIRKAENGDYKNATALCNQGYTEAYNRGSYEYASLACDCLVGIYRKQEDTEKVAEYLALKIEHQAKMQDEKRIISLARNLATFESEKERALLKQAHNKDQQIMSEKLDKYKLAGLLGFIILAVVCIALWQLRKRNKRIAAQNSVINKALTEKDILLREIHHRVKNNLQLVSSMLTLQGRSIDDESALQAINEGNSRVRSMALIHQDLYQKESITGIGVTDYLTRLTNELFSTYNIDPERIKLKTDIQEIDLDIDTLVPLGLIINELFSNCLKYAFPLDREGTLSISLKEYENKLHLHIKDDGIGFDPSTVRDNSFGTTLITALTEQLEGIMLINTDNGTDVQISISDYQIVK